MKYFFYMAITACMVGAYFVFSKQQPVAEEVKQEISVEMLQNRLKTLCAKAEAGINKLPYDSIAIPRSLLEDGSLDVTKSKSWTSGFYPGTLWQLYGYSKKEAIRKGAETWSSSVEKEKLDSGTHDLGFKVFCPFGTAYRITKDEHCKEVFITAANTLSTRFNPNVGAIRSWDHHAEVWDFPVIVDNMMNLELLFEATKATNDSSFYNIAKQHATTTLKNHYRSDYSSYHVVDYHPETGIVENRHTHQGASHESSWARGQAWGLYGFTVSYRYTLEPAFLEQAKKIAQYFFTHPNLPKDLIPYWDFTAPNIPNEPRDVSAATIAASGLIELAKYVPQNASQYLTWADEILLNLETEKYQTDAIPFFLNHSTGNYPAGSEIDVPIVYADYYYVEALIRRLEMIRQG